MRFLKTVRLSRSTHVVIFAVIALSIAACSYAYYQYEILPVKFRKLAELKAIADLKISQIESWRQERLADARMNSSGIIRKYVNQWCQDWKDESRKDEITSRLHFFQENEGYQNIILADLKGRILVSMDSRLTDLEPESKLFVDKTISLNQPIFGDFFYCQIHGNIHLDVFAPIMDSNDQPVAVLILRTNPDIYFYSFIQSWPTSWESAETMLVRMENDHTLVLNVLRHHPDSPLNLRLLNSNWDIQETLTACGNAGECAFQDYRGIDVLAEFRAIQNSRWLMIVKADKHEILGELDYKKKIICTLTVVLILMIGLGAEYLLNYVEKLRLDSKYNVERAKQDTIEKARNEIQETLIRNISQRIRAEEDLRYANETLEQRILERTMELEKVHAQVIIQEKMASIGQLAAGIAHELNNPLNFISMNFVMLSEYFEDIIDILHEYRELTVGAAENTSLFQSKVIAIHDREAETKLDYILEDAPALLKQTGSGFERISRIIQSMQDFSRADNTGNLTIFNINTGIEDTLVIAHNEYKYISDINTNLGDISDILCFPDQLNYVFLNLILNSAQSIQAQNRPEKGLITIRTWQDESNVYCKIADDGPGIPVDIRSRIFDPFFTTKSPGQGMGLGLSTSYDIIVRKHQGGIVFECPACGGTVFSIRIPKNL